MQLQDLMTSGSYRCSTPEPRHKCQRNSLSTGTVQLALDGFSSGRCMVDSRGFQLEALLPVALGAVAGHGLAEGGDLGPP